MAPDHGFSTGLDGQDFLSILSALETRAPVKQVGTNYRTACPIHGGDGPENFVLFESGFGHCHSRCGKIKKAELAKALGVSLILDAGVTINAYAAYTQLPSDLLLEWGVREATKRGKKVVEFPYMDESGTVVRVQQRLSLENKPKFEWKGRGSVALYGLHQLREIRELGYVIVVEGATDTLTLWHAGFPALGVPGGTVWRPEWNQYFEGLRVLVWNDGDDAGYSLTEDIAEGSPDALVMMANHVCGIIPDNPPKDPGDYYQAHGLDAFKDTIRNLLEKATPAHKIADRKLAEQVIGAKEAAAGLVDAPDIINRYADAIHELGYVGDVRSPLLSVIGFTSRLLHKPLHLKYLGQSGVGKSANIDAVLPLFPESAYIKYDATSEAAIIYDERPIQHRTLVFTEQDSLPQGNTPFASFFRTLMDGPDAEYVTTVEGGEGEPRRAVKVVKKGPANIITAGIRESEAQTHGRQLVIRVEDDPSRSREIGKMQGRRENGDLPAVDLDAFQALQEFIGLQGPYTTEIPYWDVMCDLVPRATTEDVSWHRNSATLGTVIRTLAVLHSDQRERRPGGRVIASLADYETARWLLENHFDASVGSGVTEKDRDAVRAVRELRLNEKTPITSAMVAVALAIQKSGASYRVARLLDKGFLVNRSVVRNRHDLDVGDSLPEACALPTVEDVRSARDTEALPTKPSNMRTQPSELAEVAVAVKAEQITMFEGSNPYTGEGWGEI